MKRTGWFISLAVTAAMVSPWAMAQTETPRTNPNTNGAGARNTNDNTGRLAGEEKTGTGMRSEGMRGDMNEREMRTDFSKRWWTPATSFQRATDLMGKPVRNSANEKLGECGELAIDPNAGRVIYAVLEFGGFLGMGEKWFAVPFSALKLSGDAAHFTMDANKETLKNAQGFDKDGQWPNFGDERWATETHRFYNQPRYWQLSDDQSGVYKPTARWQKASDLIDKKIHNVANNNELGEVENLLIDPGTGRVIYALVNFAHVEGMRGEYVVPFNALTLTTDYSHFTMDMDKQAIKNANLKPYDKNMNITDRGWAESTAKTFNVNVYWDRDHDGTDVKVKTDMKNDRTGHDHGDKRP